ncbi:MAG: signal peptidase I [Sulfurovum sp.]
MKKVKKFIQWFGRFASSWTGTIIIVLFLIFFVAQSFVIPSGSMKRTQLIGDFLFAKKFSYGIPTPHLPWLEIPLLPDFNGNGHLIEGPKPQRMDIVIFRYPSNHKIHYVKRCVAVGGDELIYADQKLLIHFHEGNEYIKANYPKDKIRHLRDKLWVENPYMDKLKGIQYAPEGSNIFQSLLKYYSYGKSIDMIPLLVDGFDVPSYDVNGKEINALYTKVDEGNFYMIGDNRDNSSDSRFWGSVPYSLIVGKPWLIYMSIEHRSYTNMLEGDTDGNGRDNATLKRVCVDMSIDSKECEKIWNNERFAIRWGRVGRRVESIQLEQPID